jgi:hypothetical protein
MVLPRGKRRETPTENANSCFEEYERPLTPLGGMQSTCSVPATLFQESVRKLDHVCKKEVVSGKVDLRGSCRREAWDRKCSRDRMASLSFRPRSGKRSCIFLLDKTRYSPHPVALHHKQHLNSDLSRPADKEFLHKDTKTARCCLKGRILFPSSPSDRLSPHDTSWSNYFTGLEIRVCPSALLRCKRLLPTYYSRYAEGLKSPCPTPYPPAT